MAYTELNDTELIAKIREGDEHSLDKLVELYLPKAYAVVRRKVPVDDVDDVVQNIFLNLITCIDKFRGESTFFYWFFILARNIIANYYRKEKKRKRHLLYDFDLSDIEAKRLGDEIGVKKLLNNIPDISRDIFIMHICDSISLVDISKSMDEKYEAVRSRYRRGKKVALDIYNNLDVN